MPDAHYIHPNGRRCMRMGDGTWKHWDHDGPEPSPREVRDYACGWVHTPAKIQYGPLPLPMGTSPEERGEFGMPGLGVGKVLDCPDDQSLQEEVMTVYRDAIVDRGVRVDAVTDEARYILDILPYILTKFLRKNAQYARAQTGHDLGLMGVIPDINRKSAALISAVWDGGTDWSGEDTDSAREIAEDLIGHLLLMLAKMEGV